MNTVIIAIVMGIMYWWCRGMILSYFGFLFISSPVTVGLVAGLLMGQPMQGLIIGGGIALVFAGIFAPGANLPTDECLAATCVIPIAIGSGMNATTAITELATTNGVYLINIDGEVRDTILNSCPYYTTYQIPAGTYPGQDEPVETITVKATIVVSESLDDDIVYDMTAAIFDHADEIASENAKGAELSLENATTGMTIPFHEGAARYYAEHGITVDTKGESIMSVYVLFYLHWFLN